MDLHEATSRHRDTSEPGPPTDRVSPCFFESGGDALYACHHHVAAARESTEALLLCNAVLHEYERTHRAVRQLAVQAARRGVHAMRFDYFATGDSAGDCAEASMARWRRDVAAALDECLRVSGAVQAGVFGIRLGANLALEAAADRDDVQALVLFAPVVDGRALLREWAGLSGAVGHRGDAASGAGHDLAEVLGFPLPSTLKDELSRLRTPVPNPALRRVLVLADSAEPGVEALASGLRDNGTKVTLETVPEARIWQHDPMEAMVPFKLIRRIMTWLEQER